MKDPARQDRAQPSDTFGGATHGRAGRPGNGGIMRKLAIFGPVVAAVLAAVAISVATSQAKWHILSETAINTQRLCRDGLTYTWASGQTDVQPPATRPVGQPRWVGPVDLLIQSGPSTLPQDETDWENQPMEGGDIFT